MSRIRKTLLSRPVELAEALHCGPARPLLGRKTRRHRHWEGIRGVKVNLAAASAKREQIVVDQLRSMDLKEAQSRIRLANGSVQPLVKATNPVGAAVASEDR